MISEHATKEDRKHAREGEERRRLIKAALVGLTFFSLAALIIV